MELTGEIYNLIKKSIINANKNKEYEFEGVFSQNLNRELFSDVLNYLNNSKLFKLFETIYRESLDISLYNTNYRITINKHSDIVDFCNTGVLNEYTIMEKKMVEDFENIKLPEYDVYFKMKNEEEKKSLDNLEELMKVNNKHFRNKKRYSFVHQSKLFRVDMTIVKSSIYLSNKIEKSGLLKSPEKYEIEIEYLNDMSNDVDNIIEILFNVIEVIQKVLNDTNHLITKTQKSLVLCEYLNLVNPKVFDDCNNDMLGYIRKIVLKNPKHYFLSYQPVTLEQTNLTDKELGKLSIKTDYSVTEKADGERMLLYVDKTNKIYMIDSRLNIRYTGTKHKHANCLLDGEFVKHTKHNTPFNQFLAFDIYFLNNEDVRSNKLIPTRFDLIKSFCKNASSQFVIKPKEHIHGDDIFKLSRKAYNKDKYEYHIDGLIYTPIDLYVGQYYKDVQSDKNTFGGTWINVFKWKPPEENSIDMLTTYGEELFIPNIGRCVLCNLQVSYRSNTDELIDPIKVLTKSAIFKRAVFKPKTFVQVYLKINDGDKRPKTKMNEDIFNNTVIEYVYEKNVTELLCWIPYRVRYDKTELYQKNNNIMNTANSYITAMNVWRSIQNPVVEDMIKGKQLLTKSDIVEANVYYSRNVNRMKILSKPMLTFHNKTIKSQLFALFKNKNYTLIDLACGKAGDLYKWMENRYSFVVGFDNNLDNIMNSVDGAYKRYYDTCQMKNIINNKFNVIFLQKDISTNWTDKDSIENEMMMKFYDVLWGNINKKEIIHSQISKYHNIMYDKFDVVSCQFAIHYMFENDDKLDAFCANINKVMKVGSYFIGTCLNGNLVNDMLSKSKKGKEIGIVNDNVVWMLEKKYDTFEPKSTGQKISVYLESINVIHDEYLVDFDLLIDKLKVYDITILTDTDLNMLKLKESINTFDKWYDDKEYGLDDVFKTYSFLNSWFVFKKYK